MKKKWPISMLWVLWVSYTLFHKVCRMPWQHYRCHHRAHQQKPNSCMADRVTNKHVSLAFLTFLLNRNNGIDKYNSEHMQNAMNRQGYGDLLPIYCKLSKLYTVDWHSPSWQSNNVRERTNTEIANTVRTGCWSGIDGLGESSDDDDDDNNNNNNDRYTQLLTSMYISH